jgi:hypothetical protein
MEDLEFGFVIWLGSLVLPLIGFILEWLIKLKDFLILKFILAAYFELKHTETSQNAEKRLKMVRLKPVQDPGPIAPNNHETLVDVSRQKTFGNILKEYKSEELNDLILYDLED